MRLSMISMGLAAFLAAGCSKNPGSTGSSADEKVAEAPPAKFVPGAMADRRFEALKLTIKAPANLEATESDGKVELTAPGIATITVSLGANERGGTRRMSSANASRVRTVLSSSKQEWTCITGPPGDHKDLLKTICGSMTPDPNPHMTEVDCKITGLDEAAATAVLAGQSGALLACYSAANARDKDMMGKTFSFARSKRGASTSRSRSTTNEDEALKACLEK
ncbi:MAG: hypothetical protein ACI9WU_004925, partial [Myxococcota bacterium]